jgi:hypothetical protein
MLSFFATFNRGNSNWDGQEKRYRSMQEHIRRAHPEHYISKLPATEESFQLMITTPPSERPPPPTSSSLGPHGLYPSPTRIETCTDVLQAMGTTGILIMATTRVPRTLPGTWTTSTLDQCCQPLAPRQHSHNCTTTNWRGIGTQNRFVSPKVSNCYPI